MNLRNLGIRWRITLGLAVILLLAVLSVAHSLYQNISVKYEAGEVATSWIPAIENLGHMKGYLSAHYLDVNDHMSGGGDADPATFTKQLQELDGKLAKATEIYAATLLTYNADSAAEGNAEKALYATYQSKRDAYFKLAKEGLGNFDGAAGAKETMELVRQDFATKAPPAFREAYAAMEAILQFNLDGTAKAATKVKTTVSAAEITQLFVSLIIVLVGLGLIWAIPRSVIGPVQEAVALAQNITKSL